MLEQPRVDPMSVFLRNGARAKASPDVNFSMRAYLERHPERAAGPERSPYLAWLKEGRAAGEIADPAPGLEMVAEVLGKQPGEVVDLLAATRTDLTERLRHGTLGEMFTKAAEVEALIGGVWPATARPVVQPFTSAGDSAMIAALHDAQRQAGFRGARAVVMINRPRWGGGRRAEGYIARALASRVGVDDVLVLYTDFDGPTPADRFPPGMREVHLATPVERYGVTREDAQQVLVDLLRSFGADVIVNVNSTLLYESLATYGRVLEQSERVFHVMFCNDQNARGHWGGHPIRHFYRSIDTATGVITDSHHLREWLVDSYCLSNALVAKLHVFSAPVDPQIPLAAVPTPGEGRRPEVFWAGRIDRQKRPELVFEIARRMPDLRFRMWGEGVAQQGYRDADVPANLTMEGAYAGFGELDLGTADAWLYTSGWDGVPSQLLEVAMTGVPIVGSLVGGTGEILRPGEAHPVAEIDDPDGYVSALRAVLADPATARAGALALRERLVAERTEAGYAEHAVRVLLPDLSPPS
jgi:glycosyltransferase involved in cell wall biosynthesis